MNLFKVSVVLISVFYIPSIAGAEDDRDARTKVEVSNFMDEYLGVYNRRFGYPERSAQFREELGRLVTMPFLQSPPTTKPRVPETRAEFTKNFEGFLNMLEDKGVVRLVWAQKEFKVLTPNKVLVNNIGQGLSADNKVVYETVSLYLLYREDQGWRIAMFSPYSVENLIHLGS